jgi:S1-C subfamily serine protease
MARTASIATCLLLGSAGLLQAQEDEAHRSVVRVFATVSPPNMSRPWEVTAPSERTGSGVVIEGKKILTNAHVVAHAQQIFVQPHKSSERLNATIELLSQDCDLAVLKLEDPKELGDAAKPLALADSLPKIKSKISVLGYPTGGDTMSVTEGVVSRIEYSSYYFGTSALRIQVDAAVNPGNSGGPGVVDGKIAGVVFSTLREAEKIGYLIPAEVVRHFLEDWRADNKYDGFPKLDIETCTLENTALRSFLKLEKKDTGIVVHRIDRPDLANLLRPWDVITEFDGYAIDNLGMVQIEDELRVHAECVVSRKAPGSHVKLKLIREGKVIELEVPTITQRNSVIQRMSGSRPTYFVYGGLVFSPVTQEMLQSAGERWLVYLAYSSRLVSQSARRLRTNPEDELVATCCAILPHRLTKGYSIPAFSVITHVNETPVKIIRQLIATLRDNRAKDFVILRFEDDHLEKVVLDPREVDKSSVEILRNNNIPSICSDDLKDLWP